MAAYNQQARRTVSLTARVKSMLAARQKNSSSEFVFPGRDGAPILLTSLDHRHAKVRELRITISQRYVHPLPESVELAFEKLEVSNQPARRKGPGTSGKSGVRPNRRKASG